MNPNCIYEVKTYWGWFRLDEGAYEDYLKDKLWITWVPGQGAQQHSAEAAPIHVSDEATSLYTRAEKLGVWTLLQISFPGRMVILPYKERMRDVDISEMNLTVRASNGLMRAGAKTLGKLAEITELPTGLKSIRNLGIKSEKDIMRGFFEICYSKLNQREKLEFWQKILSDQAECTDYGTVFVR